MFRGDHPDLTRTIGRALKLALDLGHPRTGSEHLLAALSTGHLTPNPQALDSLTAGPPAGPPAADPPAGSPAAGPTSAGPTAAGSPAADPPAGPPLDLRPAAVLVAAVLARHGATPAAIRDAAHLAAPLGAGGAVDQAVLAPLGVDLDRLLGGTPALDRRAGREPLLPFGAAKARRRCARLTPPLGLDAQAAYEASLRLALARREREHRPEHLALALIALDPGVAWVLKTAGVDREALLADLAATFPPPRRNPLLTLDRGIGHRVRHRDLVRRYERTTGRAVTSTDALPALIRG
ncbi:Clp protease N-terminal domain-containing protein [Saccharothrix carnea]|uniref:Clp protease N-terminal domain-containing protein n=1 Tax=Saccharothrix carnea TaxID=1280637 RepID=UPI003628AC73